MYIWCLSASCLSKKMARLRIACFVLLIDLDFRLCAQFVERRTEYGTIRGFVRETIPGKLVEMFLGVRYASPPTGNLRFEVCA